jgi:hypothetical protein
MSSEAQMSAEVAISFIADIHDLGQCRPVAGRGFMLEAVKLLIGSFE